uniref:T9SS type A sorting domain-containing protein n=1 Tax=uncultured Polaribacter sp. TaxID=174711 RepID=UPI002635CEDF|nr:T9SS type A sorting domain-containing protein [uncultured Polaribacter sp.]
MKFLLFFCFFCLFTFSNTAQNAIVSSGGNITSNGSLSYTIGQIVVHSNTNSAASFHLGVQQPFELIALNIEEVNLGLSFKTYPNPTTGLFNLELKQGVDFPYQLKIFDIRGRQILDQTITKELTNVNIQPYSKGVYLLQLIKSGKQIISFKLLKN